jgi:hypothetical protein
MDGQHAKVIAKLGGARVVAEKLGIGNPNTVFYWTRPGRRIPAKFWHKIAELSAEAESPISIDQLAQKNPPAEERAA